MPTHNVRSGETLATIAQKYGQTDWKAIYDHPSNVAFKKKRPNPNTIFAGDVIFIPDKTTSAPAPPRLPTDDDFESVEYDLDYRSENGRLSRYLKACYPNGTRKDIHLDNVTHAQPRLWAARQEALKIMDDYNATFIPGAAFPTVFFILTISPTLTPVIGLPAISKPEYNVLRRAFPKPKPVAAPTVTESTGAIKPGTGTRTHTDPFTGETHPISATAKTERSLVTSIRADIAESEAYKAALLRGEIGLQRPTGANVTGSDFITAVLQPGTRQVREVLVNDVKATVVGRTPVPKTTIPGSWRTEVNNAVAPGRLNLGDPALENGIRQAVQQGHIRLRQLNVNYSSSAQGQGQITGW